MLNNSRVSKYSNRRPILCGVERVLREPPTQRPNFLIHEIPFMIAPSLQKRQRSVIVEFPLHEATSVTWLTLVVKLRDEQSLVRMRAGLAYVWLSHGAGPNK